MHKLAVIGCGVVGLTSALAIQKNFGSSVKITIYTKDISPNTTGDISAGLWEPYLLQDTPVEKIEKWSQITFNYIYKLWREGNAEEDGISLQPVINVSLDSNFQVPEWAPKTLGYHKLSEKYLLNLTKQMNKKLTGGFMFVTFTWEPTIFLPRMLQKFIDNGGEIVFRQIDSFEQLSDYNIIVNCTGLNAETLVPDKLMQPVRGQVIRVEAPWQFHTILIDTTDNEKTNYVIANTKSIVLGGTKMINNYNTDLNQNDKEFIWNGCCCIVPSLNSAKIVSEAVGLRPGRKEVRLEVEKRNISGRNVNIIHNYGHGGAGVTLCIGCAEDVVNLVQEVICGQQYSKL